ncbi:YoaK family protein [Streptomyces solincola]|uniref:YoaK family protein n=1 Tax=Streptomyces solincola TaxID=2100817 RepID=UPI0015E346CE|nr:YoaK family protein [Streptomyces solincola]
MKVGGRGPSPSLRFALLLLVAASGGVETISFLGLNQVFAGVMTSNLALLGMAAGRGEAGSVIPAALALTGFAAGLTIVALYTRGTTPTTASWPRRTLLVLVAETALLGVGALAWGLTDGNPGALLRNVLQCGVAAAMGMQSAAMVTAGRTASPTTYLTGTLATYVVKGLGGGRQSLWAPLRLGAVIAGAALSAVLLSEARRWTLVPPVALLLCGLAAACIPFPRMRDKSTPWSRRRRSGPTPL